MAVVSSALAGKRVRRLRNSVCWSQQRPWSTIPEFVELAFRLGAVHAEQKATVVNGCGYAGLMKATGTGNVRDPWSVMVLCLNFGWESKRCDHPVLF